MNCHPAALCLFEQCVQKEESERKAKEEAERLEQEKLEKSRRDEEERLERKKVMFGLSAYNLFAFMG